MIRDRPSTRGPRGVPLALVHHANQYLITSGYEERDGLTEIVEGYDALLDAHERYGLPLSLHLSGTLLEALAWHRPAFLGRLRHLHSLGLVSFIGGTYSENVMPLFSDEHNRRQLREFLRLHQMHFGSSTTHMKLFWVPERVWDTDRLAPLLTDGSLPNGGYRYVLLDDRLAFRTAASGGQRPRDEFDAAFRAGQHGESYRERTALSPSGANPGSFGVFRIAGTALSVVPFSAALRYGIPPVEGTLPPELASLTEDPSARADGSIFVYADDAENTAGVGGWHNGALIRYERFLAWLHTSPVVEAVDLPAWLSRCKLVGEPQHVDRGTFYELASWGAGEDYRGWWDDPRWRASRDMLEDSEECVRRAQAEGGDAHLLELAWKHVLASNYESGWQDDVEGERQPAAWAVALASHSRSARVLVAAASESRLGPGLTSVNVSDIDGDGECEAVLCNERLFAVLSPSRGGRLLYLIEFRDDGGHLLVGNPSDDWNLQEELNR